MSAPLAVTAPDAVKALRVGIVIPAHNEAETLGKILEALLAQDWPGLTVVVVNDGSTDGTSDLLAGFPEVRQILNRPNQGLARSINTGLQALEAEGYDLGMVLHADCVPQGALWVGAMAAPFADPQVGAVVSARRLAGRPRGAERFFDAVAPQDFPNPEGKDREIPFFRDKCDAYRLSALRELGGFDTRAFYVAGEDTDLSIRMRARGLKILQSGRAEVAIGFSSHQRSLSSVFRKALQYGGAQAVLYRRHGYDGLKARASAAALLALPGVVLGIFTPFAWLLLAPALWMLASTAGPGGLPLALAAVPVGAALQALGCPPAAAWGLGALAASLLLLGRRALQAARRMNDHGEAAFESFQGGVVAFGWWALTGAGYLAALGRARREGMAGIVDGRITV
jgi:GT2 family glycosyltransferase